MESLSNLKKQYADAKPFPHIVIDNAIHPERAEAAFRDFPGASDIPWYKYENVFEKKLAFDKTEELPESIQSLCYEMNSMFFVHWLEELTGISDLVIDEGYRGGGLHCMERGGKLDVHADFNIHPGTGLYRRLNAILFLNKGWEEAWGGALEFWNGDMTECVTKVYPTFNRLVIFNVTDKSFHGLPDAMECPEGTLRKSIAWYYYTKDRPEEEKAPIHSTLYKKRPQDQTDDATEELRIQRGKRRLADIQVEVSK